MFSEFYCKICKLQIPDNIGMLLVSFLQNEIQLVPKIRSAQPIVGKVRNSERQNDDAFSSYKRETGYNCLLLRILSKKITTKNLI